MTELIIMVGLPYSGKSTYCDNMEGWTVLCPDDFRLAIHGKEFLASAEPFVWACVEASADALLRRGNKVLVDATNTNYKARQLWRKLARKHGIQLRAVVIQTSTRDCILRAELNNADHMVPIIERMADGWISVDEDDIVAIHG